jgi:hypothetical protein
LAGTLLAAVTKNAIKALVRSSSLFSKVPVIQSAAKNLRECAKATAEEVKKDSSKTANITAFDLFAHGTYLRSLLKGTPDVQKNLVAAAKAAHNAKMRLPKTQPTIVLQDSPGVAVISAAQAYASQQRLAITLHHIVFEAAIRSGVLKLEDIQKFLELEIREQDELGLVDLRNKYKLLFEAIIWARLYGFSATENKIRIVTNPLKNGRPRLEGVPPRQLEYMVKRLVNPRTDQPFASEGAVRGVSDLNQYFMKIAETSGKLEKDLNMDDIKITQYPVVKR